MQQLLGSILIENKVLQLIELQIKDGTFYFETNRRIFAEIKKLLENNKQADEKVLFYSLIDSGIDLKNEELKQYISNLVDAATTASSIYQSRKGGCEKERNSDLKPILTFTIINPCIARELCALSVTTVFNNCINKNSRFVC